MQTLFGQPPLSRAATAKAVRTIEQVLDANGVIRAADLPEEARVRLYRRLSSLFDRERDAHWARQMRGGRLSGAWRRVKGWFTDFGP